MMSANGGYGMRRVLGIVLIGVGVFGLVFAGVMRFWAYPNGLKTPLDLDIPIVGIGPAQLFDATTGQVEPVQLRADRTVKVDSQASDSKNVVVNERLCIVVQKDNPPPCVSGSDPRLLSYTTDRVAADRKTAEAVNDPKYGGNVNGDTSIKHVGLTYKWPFHAKKQTYQFFNPDVGEASPATFEGTEKINGLTLYKYVSVTPKMEADVFKGVPGYYTDTRTVWIDPVTGTIVKGNEHEIRQFRGGSLDGQTAVDLNLTFDDATVKYQTNKAKDGRNKIELASVWLPLAGLIVGVLALAGGILLLVSGRKQAPPSEVPPPPPYPGQPAPPSYGVPPASPDIAPPPPPDTEVTQPLPR
jgi:Porin PorA